MTNRSPSPTTGALRWLRGTVVGLTATGLAGAAHLLAHGVAPSGPALLALGVVVSCVGVALSGRRWTLGSLLTVLLGAQAGFHLAFVLLPLGDPGRAMTGMQPMTGVPGALPAPGWPMLAAHVLAAGLTAVLLGRGESWCWWLLELLGTAVATLRPVTLPTPADRRPVWSPQPDGPVVPLLGDGCRRRGPPRAGTTRA